MGGMERHLKKQDDGNQGVLRGTFAGRMGRLRANAQEPDCAVSSLKLQFRHRRSRVNERERILPPMGEYEDQLDNVYMNVSSHRSTFCATCAVIVFKITVRGVRYLK